MNQPPISNQPPKFVAHVTASGAKRIEVAGSSPTPQVRQALRAMRRPDQKAPPRQAPPQPETQTEVAVAPVQSQEERTERAARLVRQAIAIHGDPDSHFSGYLRGALATLDGDKPSWFERAAQAEPEDEPATITAPSVEVVVREAAVPGELPVDDTRPDPAPEPEPEDEAPGGDEDNGEQGDVETPGHDGGDGDGDGSDEQSD